MVLHSISLSSSSTAYNLFTAKQLKTQRDEVIPLNGHDANLDGQDGLEEVPLLDAVVISVAIEYLEGENYGIVKLLIIGEL